MKSLLMRVIYFFILAATLQACSRQCNERPIVACYNISDSSSVSKVTVKRYSPGSNFGSILYTDVLDLSQKKDQKTSGSAPVRYGRYGDCKYGIHVSPNYDWVFEVPGLNRSDKLQDIVYNKDKRKSGLGGSSYDYCQDGFTYTVNGKQFNEGTRQNTESSGPPFILQMMK